ncbi:hypothetical protein [Sphingomonas sp.]|uniref:hypothetical protein n=1 Tax=Sphingomonas sp. TaxID=28214 RepID=UPI0031DAADFE
MTDFLSRIRDVALLLPGSSEKSEAGETQFLVEGEPFVRVNGTGTVVQLCMADADTAPHWSAIALAPDVDWAMIEDRIARSWELVAPTELLEAGGR